MGERKSIPLFFFLVLVFSKAENQAPKGHLQPLGSHQPPEKFLETKKEVPQPEQFFKNYVLPGVPLLFKGAAKTIPAYSKWSDEYLSTKFGEIKMDVEEGKKENRSLGTFNFKLQDFIKKYKNEDMYMVESLPQLMKEDYTLLPSLACGGFTNVLQDAVVWFSSGGTKSVLHFDAVDNINCLFSGSKELFLIDKKVASNALIDRPSGAFSSVDVDKVDMYKFPDLQTVPYYNISMEEGDCFFIPYKWLHQVRSFGSRNLAVNIWWAHIRDFNKTDCEQGPYKDTHHVPLADFEFRPNEATRHRFLDKMEDKPVDLEQFVNVLQEEALIFDLEIPRTELEQRFALIDKDRDGSVTVEEIYAVPSDNVEELLTPIAFEEDGERPEEDAAPGEEQGGDSSPATAHTEL